MFSRVNLKLPKDLAGKLEAHSEHTGVPGASIVRIALIDFFKEHNLRVKYYFAHDKEGSEILDGSGYGKLLNSMYKTYYLLLEGNPSNNRNI